MSEDYYKDSENRNRISEKYLVTMINLGKQLVRSLPKEIINLVTNHITKTIHN